MEILFSVLFPSAVLLNKKKIFMSTSLKSITVYQINILSYIYLSIDLSCPDRTHGADKPLCLQSCGIILGENRKKSVHSWIFFQSFICKAYRKLQIHKSTHPDKSKTVSLHKTRS